MIANVNGFEDFHRYQINIDWTISKLRDFLVAQLDLKGDQRLKDLTEGRMFFKEEMENKLRNYEIFREGGARIQVEMGRPCTMAEINVNVSQFKVFDSYEQFYFNADITVKEAKVEICKRMDSKLDPDKVTLYRVDAFEEPTYAVRRVGATFNRNNVSNGEFLILKSEKDLDPSEKFKLSVHMTASGLSEDSQYLQDIDVPREITLGELKDQLLDMPSLAEYARTVESHNFIRIREKTFNGFFGRIFRENEKTLKQHGIKDRGSLVIQILTEEEVLGPDDFILTFSRRDTLNRTYVDLVQVKLTATRISDLQLKALELFGGEDSTVASIKIAKHVPHQFEWKVWNPDEELEIKQKKKTIKVRAGDQDVKKPPLLLKDGDEIGVLIDGSAEDDMQTEADVQAAEVFKIKQAEK